MTVDESKTVGRTGQPEESATNATLEGDKSQRIGSAHGDDTEVDEKTGYARDIAQDGHAAETGREARSRGAGLSGTVKGHPSRNLESRSRGYGIGGGYERPYRKEKPKTSENEEGLYGPLPHAGYYGSGMGSRPFKKGQAGFADELSWYSSQYGERTSGYDNPKKKK
jgi:hypothetical protein